MALKKRESKEPSCPLWLATYGDMVTNMLVFFVLLLSMSEIRKDERFLDFMQALREAFGYVGGMEQLPYEEMRQTKNEDLAELMVIPIRPEDYAESPDEGIRDRYHTVTNLRREEKFDVGSKCTFPELSATLTPEQDPLIQEYVEKLRGHRSQIEVRGHCSRCPVEGSGFGDHFELSLQRARAVAEALVRHGIERERLVVAGAGYNEPLITDAYTPAERQMNDRVEVLQVNRLVETFDAGAAGDVVAPGS